MLNFYTFITPFDLLLFHSQVLLRNIFNPSSPKKETFLGSAGWLNCYVPNFILAWFMISGLWDQVIHWALCWAWSLPQPLSLSYCLTLTPALSPFLSLKEYTHIFFKRDTLKNSRVCEVVPIETKVAKAEWQKIHPVFLTSN